MFFRAISCLLGEHWKHLEPSEKQEYTEQAKVLAETYKEKNPDCWKRRSRSHSDSDFPIKREDDNHDAVITSAGSTGGSAGGSGSGSSQYELEYSALHSESDNEDVGPILPHQGEPVVHMSFSLFKFTRWRLATTSFLSVSVTGISSGVNIFRLECWQLAVARQKFKH